MRPDRMTTKSREAFQDAARVARRASATPSFSPSTCSRRCSTRRAASRRRCCRRRAPTSRRCATPWPRKVDGVPRVTRRRRARAVAPHARGHPPADDEAKQLKDDFVSVEHYVLAMAKHDRDVAGALRAARGRQLREAARRRSRACAAASASPTRIPRGSSRRSRSTAAT